MPEDARQTPPKRAESFATTRWSLVLAAGDHPSPSACDALHTLCSDYWYPLYAYIRRQGYDAVAAEDLAQGFFVQLLDRRDLAKADPGRGRFRAFLLTALKHYLSNQRQRQRVLKRGGDRITLSLDVANAENRYAREPAVAAPPERDFDRRWALLLLEHVRDTLRARYIADGNGSVYNRLEGVLTGEGTDTNYEQLASELGMSLSAIKVAVHRLRQRFGTQLRKEIAETVADPNEVDAEIRDLFEILRA